MEGKENGQKRVPFNEVDDVRVMEDPSSHLAAGQPSLPSLPPVDIDSALGHVVVAYALSLAVCNKFPSIKRERRTARPSSDFFCPRPVQ